MRRFKVTDGDKETEVFIVGTPEEMKDKSYMDYLEQAEREKTLDQLKKKPPRAKSLVPKGEVAEALKDFIRFRERKKQGRTRKYY